MKPISAMELSNYLGMQGKYKANGFSFYVTVEDARTNYNILEFLVRPVAGEGESWISASFITLDPPAEMPAQDKESSGGAIGGGREG